MIYILTGKTTSIKIVFKYNLNGLLNALEIEGDYGSKQLRYMFYNENFPFPYEEKMIEDVKKLGHFNIQVQEEDLSFERFWLEYGYKTGKKRVEPMWNKLSKANKILVFAHLPKYEAHLKNKGIQKAYPKTYLNQEYWNDEY